MTRQAQALRAAVAALEDDALPEDVEASLIRRGLDREAATGILAEAQAQIAAERARGTHRHPRAHDRPEAHGEMGSAGDHRQSSGRGPGDRYR
ncbi:MAG TPA: hypothetical protein VIU44_00130, partial [Gaiellaceae bacterium]